jgi:hypothetical protein
MSELSSYTGMDTPCSKCGNEGARTTYLNSMLCIHRSDGDFSEIERSEPDNKNERLHRTCWNCGYQWDEATLDREVT